MPGEEHALREHPPAQNGLCGSQHRLHLPPRLQQEPPRDSRQPGSQEAPWGPWALLLRRRVCGVTPSSRASSAEGSIITNLQSGSLQLPGPQRKVPGCLARHMHLKLLSEICVDKMWHNWFFGPLNNTIHTFINLSKPDCTRVCN